ncbi:uncharacterized protein LOC143018573 [Oratosquilla oratoria]|uniref:uncharacterized protein LOC143018573 n=1 Tax=Oratosquilla oratoria TaxID=337810 RepID=UPI003F75B834
MSRKEMVLRLTLVFLATCSASPIGIGTVFDDGCTSQTAVIFKELKWRELLFVNSTIWIEVHSLQSAEASSSSSTSSSSSLHCPRPCDARKNTLYKVNLESHETERNMIKVNFAAHEEPGIKGNLKKEDPIQCVCHKESLLVFEGSSTLVTCKDEAEVNKVRESWRARLDLTTATSDRTSIIISVAAGFVVIAVVCVLCVVVRVCRTSEGRTGRGNRNLSRRPTPLRSTQTHISTVESKTSMSN